MLDLGLDLLFFPLGMEGKGAFSRVRVCKDVNKCLVVNGVVDDGPSLFMWVVEVA